MPSRPREGAERDHAGVEQRATRARESGNGEQRRRDRTGRGQADGADRRRGEAPAEHDVERPEAAGGDDEHEAHGLRPREALPEQRHAGAGERNPDQVAAPVRRHDRDRDRPPELDRHGHSRGNREIAS